MINKEKFIDHTHYKMKDYNNNITTGFTLQKEWINHAHLLLGMLFVVAIGTGCRERYDAQYETPDAGFLVVEGFINYGSTPTQIKLSRSIKPDESRLPYAETGANVLIESDANDQYALTETSDGTYTSAVLNLAPTKRYRIVIQAQGKHYESEYTGVQTTPEIDSITWRRQNNGIELWTHANDPTNSSIYYQWKFEETWEVISPFTTTLTYYYDNQQKLQGVRYRNADRSIDTSGIRCWPSTISRNLIIGSTEQLTDDVVSMPFHGIPPNSEKLAVMYSILLKQYKLSARGYEFLLQMKKNNEQLGSIFDAQPSELPGNIICTTVPDEVVVGFVEVMQEKTKRLFISRNQIGSWGYINNCISTAIDNHPDSIMKYALQLTPTSVFMDDPLGNILSFNATQPPCVDCRLRGGTNVKPSYWP